MSNPHSNLEMNINTNSYVENKIVAYTAMLHSDVLYLTYDCDTSAIYTFSIQFKGAAVYCNWLGNKKHCGRQPEVRASFFNSVITQ